MKGRCVIPAIILSGMWLGATEKRPNIIFIITDDQHESTMGCWGNEDVYTPNIDRLATEGIRFTRAYCASSISAASRYGILSGRFCGRCSGETFMRKFPAGTPSRVDNVIMYLEPDRPSLPSMLKSAGYTTGMVGKWHLGENIAENRPENRKERWDKLGLKYYPQDADPSLPDVEEALVFNQKWFSARIKETGFDYADNIYWGNLKEVYNDSLNRHNIDWTVKGAIDFMQQTADQPFFLYFSTTLHHGPTPQNSVNAIYERITGAGISKTKMNVMPDRSSIFKRLRDNGYGEEQAYALWLDDAVGALLSELEKEGKLDNTVIFYLSDHGIEQKASLYEGGVRTPMIAWGVPLGCKGEVCSRLVHLCDLVPTCLSIAGIAPNSSDYQDGNDITPLFTHSDREIHKSVFSEIGYARCVVTEKYKYIAVRYPEDIQKKIDRGLTPEERENIGYVVNQSLTKLGKTNPNYFANDQLYDLETDPKELKNLSGDPKYKKVLKQMKAELKSYLKTFENRPFEGFVN